MVNDSTALTLHPVNMESVASDMYEKVAGDTKIDTLVQLNWIGDVIWHVHPDNWSLARKLHHELIALSARDGIQKNVIVDPLDSLVTLKRELTGQKYDAVVLLEDAFSAFVRPLFPKAAYNDTLHYSRARNVDRDIWISGEHIGRNVAAARLWANKTIKNGSRVLILDDVLFSGGTVNACLRDLELKQRGATIDFAFYLCMSGAKEKLSNSGDVYCPNILAPTDRLGQDAWHSEDYAIPNELSTLLPVMRSLYSNKITRSQALNTLGLAGNVKNPPLWLYKQHTGNGGFVNHMDSQKIVENFDAIAKVLWQLHYLQTSGTGARDAALDSIALE